MEAKLETRATTTTPLDPAFVEDWSQRFIEAWNTGNGDLMAALCVEDGNGLEWIDPLLPHPARTRAEAKRFVDETAKAFDGFRIEWRHPAYLSQIQPTALIPWRMTGTMVGTWSYTGLESTGESFELFGVDEFTFQGELMVHNRSSFDRTELARQLGVLPPIGSKGEQMMTRVQNFRNRIKRRRA